MEITLRKIKGSDIISNFYIAPLVFDLWYDLLVYMYYNTGVTLDYSRELAIREMQKEAMKKVSDGPITIHP